MSLVTLRPGRRVTLAPYLDAQVVEVARDGAVKLELITTGPQLPTGECCQATETKIDETADSECSRFFAEFA